MIIGTILLAAYAAMAVFFIRMLLSSFVQKFEVGDILEITNKHKWPGMQTYKVLEVKGNTYKLLYANTVETSYSFFLAHYGFRKVKQTNLKIVDKTK
jgi:hypothetical protein